MIHVKNMNYSYNWEPPFILKNINLDIEKGSYVSILGENGSAKTTLIKLILKLLNPCSGNIETNTSRVGYVPQHVEKINSQFPITVYETLRCHLKVSKFKDIRAIDEILQLIGIYDLRNKLLSTLSGGQVQKVFIARALLCKPELIVLDEPSTGIDVGSQHDIYSLLKKLNKELNMTIISVEHNLEAAIKNSTHICRLQNGTAVLLPISEYSGGKLQC